MAKEIQTVDHPNSIELFSKIETGYAAGCALLQRLYELLPADEAISLKKEYDDMEKGYNAAIVMRNQNNIMHTTIVHNDAELAKLSERLDCLEEKLTARDPKAAKRIKTAYHNGHNDGIWKAISNGRH